MKGFGLVKFMTNDSVFDFVRCSFPPPPKMTHDDVAGSQVEDKTIVWHFQLQRKRLTSVLLLFHEWSNLESLVGWILSYLGGYCGVFVYIY
jgi:hypothetical protein